MAVQEFVGAPDTAGEGGQKPRLPVEVINLTWCYTHYPSSWAFEGGEWLPLLTRLSFRRGLNGQAEDGDSTIPEAHASKKGATIIKVGHPKLGPFKNYRTKIPAYMQNGGAIGDFFGTMWDHWKVVGRKPKNKFDYDGFRAFRKHLVTAGIVEPISATVADSIVETLENNITNLKNLPSTPSRAERITELTALASAMRESLENIEEEFENVEEEVIAPKPVVRTRKLGKPTVEES